MIDRSIASALVSRAEVVAAQCGYARESLAVARQENGHGILGHDQWLNVLGAVEASEALCEAIRNWASSPAVHEETDP